MSKIRVMLVDDHTVLRAGLRMLINGQVDMEVVAEADNTRDALARALEQQPELILLDLTMPGGGSLPLIEKLQASDPVPRVLVLTMHDDPSYVRAALAAGASGYLVKTIREQDLLEAIRTVQRGRLIIDLDDETSTLAVFQTLGIQRASDYAGAAGLSKREQQVLELLGQGLTNQAISEKLDVSPKTVATYRARIGEKLGLKTTADYVKYTEDLAK
ncbi:MAG: response regulator [Planctomycetota bacterium]